MPQSICRICAIENDDTEGINLFDRSARKLLRQINLVTGVFVSYIVINELLTY